MVTGVQTCALPIFITLLNSENLHQARHLSGSTRIRDLNSPLLLALGDILERGQKQGLFRAGIDPMQLYITIAGCSYFYLSNIHTLTAVFSRDFASAKMRTQRLAHITEVISAFVLI